MSISRLAEIDADLPDVAAAPGIAPGGTRRLLWLETLLIVATCWVAAAVFRPAFSTVRTFAAPTISGIVIAAVLAVVAGHRGLALRWSLSLSAVVALLFVSYTILVGTLAGGVVPGGDTINGLRQGAIDGFAALLGDELPLVNQPLARVFVTLAAWLTAAVAVELCRRSPLPAVPLLAPIALFTLALPVVASRHPPSFWHIGAFIALALLVILVRAVPDPKATGTVIGSRPDGITEFHSRSLLSARLFLGVPLIALCASVAPFVGNVTTRRDPYDPRSLRDDVVKPLRVNDPLGEYKRIVGQSPARPAFQIRVSGAEVTEVARIAIVRLDAYDGVRWTTNDRYRIAGPVLSNLSRAVPPARDVTLTLSNLDLEDPWLPSAGTPTRIDLGGVGFDSRTNDLLATGSLKGLGYELRTRIVLATPTDLGAAIVTPSAGTDLDRSLPGGLPPNIGRIATEATAGATSPAETLDKLANYLRTGFALDPASPAGHSAGRLDQFLRVDRSGSAEQFASAFAVMARTLGYPTRVVVGYKLVAQTDGQPRALEFITSANYHVWAEVHFDNLGWVAFDPTPSGAGAPPTKTDTANNGEAVTPGGGGEQRTPHPFGPSETNPNAAKGTGWWHTVVTVVLSLLGALALVAIGCGIVLGLKARRRRRRRTTGPVAERVVGAWDEVLDRLVELHFPVAPSMTPREIARATQAVYGTAAALPLSFLVPDVGAAVFGRNAPEEQVAMRVWNRALEFEQNLAITLNTRQRWRARLSLRSLRRFRRTDETPSRSH